MSVKSCITCTWQDCMLTLRSASSTWTQWNTSDSSYPPKDYRWTPPRYPRSRIGPNHRRSEMYKLSSASPTSIYLETTLPLNHLCKKSTTWHFGVEEAKAFQNLKKAFRSAPVLAHWAPDLPMMVETDTSNCAIAGILSVTTEDGEIWPVAFYSCTLQSAEQNYDMHDKELLVIYEAFKSWHHYLEGFAKTIDTV